MEGDLWERRLGLLAALWLSYQSMYRSGAVQVLLADIEIFAYRYATGSWVKIAFAYSELSTRFSIYTFIGRQATGIEDEEHRWRKSLAMSIQPGEVQDLQSMRSSRGMPAWLPALLLYLYSEACM